MAIWRTEISLEVIVERNRNTLVDATGIRFTEIGDDFLTAEITLGDHHKQPIGIMHGGVSCVLAETVGSTAANFCVDPNLYYCVGLDINTNHIHSIVQGIIVGKAIPYHLGKSTQVWGINVHEKSTQRLISVNRLTMAVLAKKK